MSVEIEYSTKETFIWEKVSKDTWALKMKQPKNGFVNMDLYIYREPPLKKCVFRFYVNSMSYTPSEEERYYAGKFSLKTMKGYAEIILRDSIKSHFGNAKFDWE